MKVGRPLKLTADEYLTAIKGSDGIKAAIIQRLGVDRKTLESALKRYPTLVKALEDEQENTDDLSESLLVRNIKLGLKLQQDTGEQVESGDAKWWLEHRRRQKFSKRQEITGANGNAVVFRVIYDDGISNQTPSIPSEAE